MYLKILILAFARKFSRCSEPCRGTLCRQARHSMCNKGHALRYVVGGRRGSRWGRSQGGSQLSKKQSAPGVAACDNRESFSSFPASILAATLYGVVLRFSLAAALGGTLVLCFLCLIWLQEPTDRGRVNWVESPRKEEQYERRWGSYFRRRRYAVLTGL